MPSREERMESFVPKVKDSYTTTKELEALARDIRDHLSEPDDWCPEVAVFTRFGELKLLVHSGDGTYYGIWSWIHGEGPWKKPETR
jgi:hypothetical protein